MNTPLHRSPSPAPNLVPSTAGIRVVLFEADNEIRIKCRTAIRREHIFHLVGEAQDWNHCSYLLEETVPELLVARLESIPTGWWADTPKDSCFPLVLSLGESSQLQDSRVLQALVLPLDVEQVQSALIHAQGEVYTRKAQELSYLLRQYTASSPSTSMYLASISVEHEGKKLHLDTRTIAAIHANANYCRLHTASGVYEIRETISGLCSKLDPTQFARIHRSVIVNVSQVRELSVSHDIPTSVVLQDGTELPVGPNFRSSLSELPLRKRA